MDYSKEKVCVGFIRQNDSVTAKMNKSTCTIAECKHL